MRSAAGSYVSTPGRSGSPRPLPFSTAPIRKIRRTCARRARPGANRVTLPAQGHLPGDLLVHRQCQLSARRNARRGPFRGAPNGPANSVASFRHMSQESSRTTFSITTTSCCTGVTQWPSPPSPPRSADASTTFSSMSTSDEYQDTNRLQAEILLALRPDGSGLTVSRRR
jgi:hypothetical protein